MRKFIGFVMGGASTAILAGVLAGLAFGQSSAPPAAPYIPPGPSAVAGRTPLADQPPVPPPPVLQQPILQPPPAPPNQQPVQPQELPRPFPTPSASATNPVAAPLAPVPMLAPPEAIQQPPQAPIATASNGACQGGPAMPARWPRVGQALTLEQLDWTRDVRDTYLRAADPHLKCLDGEIQSRMRQMMAANTVDPRVDEAGAEYRAITDTAANLISRFAILCYEYEGRTGLVYTPGCVVKMPG